MSNFLNIKKASKYAGFYYNVIQLLLKNPSAKS